MRIEVLPDAPSVGARAATRVRAAVLAHPDAWLGLPTGATPIPMYAELERLGSTGACDLSLATACAIDEFCAPPRATGTNAAFYRQHLRVQIGNLRCPDHAAADPEDEIRRLADAIRHHDGLDLCFLGIGRNGHVAFNEPGSTKESSARVVDLAEATRDAHAEAFGGLAAVPRKGMTLGVADLLASQAIVVLATGAKKAAVVRHAIEGQATADVPASWLQDHPDVTWLLDKAAATLLSTEARC